MKRFICGLLIIAFLFSFMPPGYSYPASSMASEFLCEVGMHLYRLGRYEEALHEFKKALLVSPQYAPALKYIQMIEEITGLQEEVELPLFLPQIKPQAGKKRGEVMQEYLENTALQREMAGRKKPITYQAKERELEEREELSLPSILTLGESLRQLRQPIEIERGKSIIVIGRNIQRFLVTQPDILSVERKSSDEILVTGKSIGYTYLHTWDDGGRWTLEFLCILPRPKGPTLEEEMLREEEGAATFKLKYAVGWNSYEQGRRLDDLERRYYSWAHNLGLIGATPYGNVDSSLLVRSLRESTDLTHFTLGLTEGKLGPFKGFTLRGFDIYSGFSNLASGGISSLRGGMINSPAFHKKIDYTAFWGRESTGKYGALSPGLQKMKRSYFEGINFNYLPKPGGRLGFSVLHGYGRDRSELLRDYSYDAQADWLWGNWGYHYEAGFDSNAFAHLFSSSIIRPRLKFSYELRDIEKNYFNIAGESWRRGERGGIFNLNLKPVDALEIYNRLDIYQDRLFPSLDGYERLNEDYDFNARYTLDPSTSLRASYSLQNDLGKAAESRYQMVGVGVSRTFNFIRKINTYLDYRHKERKSFTNHASDYINENILAGLRFNLISHIYYFLNQQWNWLEERYYGNRSQPRVWETGVDLSRQIGTSPFYENIRFLYRDEQDTGSVLSFLSGEDYIEGYTEISYRPQPSTEAYLSTRIRNIWADNPSVTKRIEVDFNAGLRHVWDTGLRWDSQGTIEGYVFRDLNSDGLRQRDEAPLSDIKILLGKNKSATTDIFGYYKFSKVRGKKAYVVIDVSSLPTGFVLTVPPRQEVAIVHRGISRVDFGVISRCEISGIVFYDANGNNEFDPSEQPIRSAVLTLENGMKALTGGDGRYYFRNVPSGEHTITLLLNSLPTGYLPKVPITKEIDVFEGLAYYHNIPLKEAKK